MRHLYLTWGRSTQVVGGAVKWRQGHMSVSAVQALEQSNIRIMVLFCLLCHQHSPRLWNIVRISVSSPVLLSSPLLFLSHSHFYFLILLPVSFSFQPPVPLPYIVQFQVSFPCLVLFPPHVSFQVPFPSPVSFLFPVPVLIPFPVPFPSPVPF